MVEFFNNEIWTWSIYDLISAPNSNNVGQDTSEFVLILLREYK